MLGPKVGGAYYLHESTRDIPLDFFVLFSSIASVVGSPGQCNYAAANAFLDALAAERVRLGKPALAVQWGAWSSVGMAAEMSDVLRRRRARSGIGEIPLEAGFASLAQLIRERESCAAIAPIRWPDFLAQFGSDVPGLYRDVAAAVRVSRTTTEGELEALLAATRPEDRFERCLEYIEATLKTILRMNGRERIAANEPLKDLGVDSLMAVELRNELSRSIGRRLPATLLFDRPTMEDIATVLVGETAENGQGAPTAPNKDVEEEVAALEHEQVVAELSALVEELNSER